jgi:hypothetical protein
LVAPLAEFDLAADGVVDPAVLGVDRPLLMQVGAGAVDPRGEVFGSAAFTSGGCSAGLA